MMMLPRSIVVLSLLGVSIAMAAAPDAVTIRKSLAEGVENYHSSMTMNLTIDMQGNPADTSITSQSKYAYKLGKPGADGKSAPCELTTTVEKLDFTGILDALVQDKDAAMKPTTVKGTMGDRGHFKIDTVAVDPLGVLLGASSNSVQDFVELPEKPVSIGDTWVITIPKGPLSGKEDQKLTAKYVGDKELNGKPVYILSLTGTLKTDIDSANLPKPDPKAGAAASLLADSKILVHSTGDITEEALVDKATGRTLQATMKVKSKLNLDISGGSMKIDATGNSTATITADK